MVPILLGCRSPEPEWTHRGIILISIDTLRADHLGLYGYSRDTSPFLDSLADRGVLFENCFAQLPGTLPSHMSMFTGLYPSEHGVYPPDGVLPNEIVTVPEILRARGLTTGGFTEGGYVHARFGFDRGFESFSDDKKAVATDIERTFDRGKQFLTGLGPEERFFLFLHTYAVHDPYFPPPPYASLFWDGAPPQTFEPTGPNLTAFNRGDLTLTREGAEYFEALYDASIRYVDDQLRALFEEAGRLGLLDETAIVITSDHGEEFLEHGQLAHQQMYREHLHVPLLILAPGVESRRVSEIVRLVDLGPTLLDLAGVEPRSMSGRSLRPFLYPGRERPSQSTAAWDEAYAEGISLGDRTLFRRLESGEIVQFLHWGSQLSSNEIWLLDELSVDVFKAPVTFRAIAYREPRELSIFSAAGELLTRVLVAEDRWTTVEVPVARSEGESGPWHIRLESSGCTVPSDVGDGQDSRCLAMRIADLPVQRFEAFDITRDPAQAQPILGEVDVRTLLRKMRDYDRPPVAERETKPLEADLEERLRALGYLE